MKPSNLQHRCSLARENLERRAVPAYGRGTGKRADEKAAVKVDW